MAISITLWPVSHPLQCPNWLHYSTSGLLSSHTHTPITTSVVTT